MRSRDLGLEELLQFDPEGGILRFAGERVLLLDAVALGLLRRELIDTLGLTGARAVLTRFGYAHGWRTAENLRSALPWDSEEEWRHVFMQRAHADCSPLRLDNERVDDEGVAKLPIEGA